jgi:hypothetical protein
VPRKTAELRRAELRRGGSWDVSFQVRDFRWDR